MKPEKPSASPPPVKRPPSRLRGWLKRLLWTGFGLLVVLVVFHRPILRFAVNYGAKSLAKSGGMELNWFLDGTVVSGVDMKDVSISGGSDSPIKSLKAERVRADYSLWRLIKGETGSFVDELIMENVDLVMDPSKFSKRDPEDPKKETPAPPKIAIPRLRLQNVNAHIILPGGDVVASGLNFTLEQGKTGTLEIRGLQLPAGLRAMRDVKGQTAAESAKITLTSLRLWQDVTARSMTVDLGSLHERKLSFDTAFTVPGGIATNATAAGPNPVKVFTGNGDIQITGSLENIGRTPVMHGVAKLAGIAPSSLVPWVSVPPEIVWREGAATLTFNGEMDNPGALRASANVTGAGFTAGNLKVDRTELDVSLLNGGLMLRMVNQSGENRIEFTGHGNIPGEWNTVSRIQVEAKGTVNAPQVSDFFVQNAPVAGRAVGELSVTVKEGRLENATADLKGTQWLAQGVPVETVEIVASTNGNELRFAKLKALLDAQNTVEATGTLGFSGSLPLQASWQIDLPNMERLSSWSAREETPGPDAGWLKGTGNVAGAIGDWQRQDFSKSNADIKLDASGVAWKTGRLQSLAIEATVTDGRANLQQFVAVLNEKNRLTATGAGTLAPPWEYSAKVDGDLSQLPDFNGWMEAFGANRFVSGKAIVKWEGSGRMSEWSVIGGGTANVESLKLAGMEEAAALSIKSSHSGRRADVSVFEASLGQFKFSAPFVLTDKLIEIPVLKVNAGNLPPVEGHVKLPLEFGQEDNAASPIAASGDLDVSLTVKSMDLVEAAKAAGLKPPLKGKVDADVKVSGTIRNPAAAIALKLQALSFPDIKQKLNPADAKVNVTLKDGKLDAVAEVNQKPFQTARAVAAMALDLQKVLRDPQAFLDTPLDATVTLPDSDLNGLRQFITGIASMKGRMGVTAKVTGTLAKPTITGSANAAATSVSFSDPDVPAARDVKLTMRFAGKQMFIEEARALMAGGNLSARGTVDWTDAANPKIDASLTAKEALILRDENMSMRADGNVTCRGSLTQALVSGRVELVRGRVYKEIEFLPLSLPNQLPPAPPAVTVSRSNAPTFPPPFDKWTLAVDIVTRDPIRLLGNVLNGGVVSNLRLTGTGANPVLVGKATLQDARVRLPFSRMNISRGEIIFTKDKPFEPVLDVQGDAFINNYQITLNANGPALDPKLRFSSSPPLSEGEIATLLATGSTSGDLRSSQGEAANRAAFLLLSQTYRKLFRKSGHTRIDREPPRLSFSFSLLNNSGGARSVSAVYEITDHLQAVGSISQAGSFRGLLYYMIRFR